MYTKTILATELRAIHISAAVEIVFSAEFCSNLNLHVSRVSISFYEVLIFFKDFPIMVSPVTLTESSLMATLTCSYSILGNK